MFIEQDKHILLDEILMKICYAVKIRKFEMAKLSGISGSRCKAL